MAVTEKIAAYKNRQQVPDIIGDQLIYTSMRQLQWQYPNRFGKEKLLQIKLNKHSTCNKLTFLSHGCH